MARPSLRLRTVAACAAVSALWPLAAGCGGGGGGGGSAEDGTAGLTPQQVLAQARTAAAGVRSFRFTLDATTDTTLSGPPVGAEAVFSGKLLLSGEGRVARPKRMSVDVQITAQGFPFQGNLTRVDDALYLTVLGQDFRLATPPSVLAPSRPERMPRAVLAWVEAPREVGRETVAGTPTVHLRGRIGTVALTDVAGLLNAIDGTSFEGEETAATLRRGTVDVWIGTGDLLIRKARADLASRGKLRSLPDVSALTVDATLEFSDFDEPVQIEAPPSARPLDLNDLGSVLGG